MDARSARAELPGLVADAPPELIAFRQTDYDMPFWARSNSFDARWNVAGDPPTQYWSLHPDGAWAEFIRQEELLDDASVALVRRSIWACRVPRGAFLDLRDAATCATHGVEEDALVSSDWSACQDLATRLRATGCPGVLAPSAALPGHTNLTIFGARRTIDWQSRPALRSTVPATIVAVGSPPPGLAPRVLRSAPRGTDTLF